MQKGYKFADSPDFLSSLGSHLNDGKKKEKSQYSIHKNSLAEGLILYQEKGESVSKTVKWSSLLDYMVTE